MGVFQFNLRSRVYKICHHKLVNEDKNMLPTVDVIAAGCLQQYNNVQFLYALWLRSLAWDNIKYCTSNNCIK